MAETESGSTGAAIMSETPKETAERIAKAHVNWPQGYKAFARAVAALEDALKARDERAAKIVENAWRRLDALNAEAAGPMRAVLNAIRGRKTNGD